MRIDVVTIFPDYLAPLGLSLLGRAQRDGLLEVHVHDLRRWTQDRHRTVDDTPYGGGAGMVMRPEPWGEALDEVCTARPGRTPHLIVPGPGGEVFTQEIAGRIAAEDDWLVFACGRYEGIDERVYEEFGQRYPLSVLSLGDYVLNGGEVAVLAITEAVGRLLRFGTEDLFLRGLITRLGLPCETVRYDRRARLAGESKYTLKKMLHLARRGFESARAKASDTPQIGELYIERELMK